jgi:hypothetical protein
MTNLNGLKRSLANKLWLGCANSTQVIKDNTPIDTQRLFESVDSTNVVETQENVFKCRIVVGGKSLYGVRREQDIKKPVNYALQVESRHGFVRKSLSQITETIMQEFE